MCEEDGGGGGGGREEVLYNIALSYSFVFPIQLDSNP